MSSDKEASAPIENTTLELESSEGEEVDLKIVKPPAFDVTSRKGQAHLKKLDETNSLPKDYVRVCSNNGKGDKYVTKTYYEENKEKYDRLQKNHETRESKKTSATKPTESKPKESKVMEKPVKATRAESISRKEYEKTVQNMQLEISNLRKKYKKMKNDIYSYEDVVVEEPTHPTPHEDASRHRIPHSQSTEPEIDPIIPDRSVSGGHGKKIIVLRRI
jgi:hypothetical protein